MTMVQLNKSFNRMRESAVARFRGKRRHARRLIRTLAAHRTLGRIRSKIKSCQRFSELDHFASSFTVMNEVNHHIFIFNAIECWLRSGWNPFSWPVLQDFHRKT